MPQLKSNLINQDNAKMQKKTKYMLIRYKAFSILLKKYLKWDVEIYL